MKELWKWVREIHDTAERTFFLVGLVLYGSALSVLMGCLI